MRLPDWPDRLIRFMEDRQRVPFKWGEQDCVTYAMGAVKAMTGTDHLDDLPTWSDKASAQASIEAVGGLEKALDARFSRKDLPQRGDVGMVVAGDTAILGVVYPPNVWIADVEHVRRMSMKACRAFWSV